MWCCSEGARNLCAVLWPLLKKFECSVLAMVQGACVQCCGWLKKLVCGVVAIAQGA